MKTDNQNVDDQAAGHPILVAVDTTEIFESPFLDSPRWQQLWAYLQRTKSSLALSEVVIEESKRHYRRRLLNALNKLRAATRDVNETLGREQAHSLELDVETECGRYEADLMKILGRHSVTTPKYSEVPIAHVMERCLDSRKPFDGEGKKGFRDAVIWETVLAEARKLNQPLIIVTGNSKDFGSHEQIDSVLAEEARAAGVTAQVCQGLERFGDEYAKPHLSRLDEFKGQVEASAETVFDEHVREAIQERLSCYSRRDFRHDIVAAYVYEVEEPTKVDVADVYEVFENLSCSIVYGGEMVIELEGVEYEGRGESPSGFSFQTPGGYEVHAELSFRNRKGTLEDLEVTVEDVEIDFDEDVVL